MKVACIQPEICQEISKSYSHIEDLLKKLLKKFEDIQIACLPERWVPYLQNLSQNIQKERGEHYNFVKDLAKKYNIKLLSGAIWEQRKNLKKPSVTCYYFNEKGEEIGRQDKIHLYSYEQGNFEPGRELRIFKLGNSNFAILICFDVAFFETPRLAIENGADILFTPTLIREEGMDNWKIYLQARALENRIPITACNSVGNVLDRKFLGNSKILSFINGYISPSKLKIVEGPLGESGFVFDDVDLEFPRKLRKIRLSEKVEKSKIGIKRINN
jgi:predicted amidohydrolase